MPPVVNVIAPPNVTFDVPASEPIVVLFPPKCNIPPLSVTAVVVGRAFAAAIRNVPAETVVVPE